MALNVRGERASAEVLLDDVDDVRARLERAYLRSLSEPDRAGELLDVATSALPELQRSGDERALGRAWYSIAHVRGGFYCEYAAMEDAANKTATCFSRAGWSASGAVDLIGNALYFGPKPVEEAVAECNELRTRHASDRASDANIAFWLGLLEALRGNFDAGRAHVEDARATFQDLGLLWGVDTYGRGLGTIEYLAGQFADAERVLRESCRWIQENEQWPVLATRAAELAAVIYEQGHYNEASAWVDVARESAGEDDLDAALTRVPVEAKLLARRGSTEEAEGLLRGVLERAATTDALNRQGDALSALGVVLKLADRTDEADAVLAEALALTNGRATLPRKASARTRSRRRRLRMTKSPAEGALRAKHRFSPGAARSASVATGERHARRHVERELRRGNCRERNRCQRRRCKLLRLRHQSHLPSLRAVAHSARASGGSLTAN